MSQDIRNYFKVTNSNTCGMLFKKTKMLKNDYEITTDSKNSNIIEAQPKKDITVEAFTDGSTIGNGGSNPKGGIGVYFPGNFNLNNVSLNFDDFKKENSEYVSQKATNNITELLAISIAIQLITNRFKQTYPCRQLEELRIILYTDSEYSINCITKWAVGWERNGWQKKTGKKTDREIKNLDLIKKLYKAYTTQRIKFVHVNSHTREPRNKSSVEWRIWYGNEMADKLARTAAK